MTLTLPTLNLWGFYMWRSHVPKETDHSLSPRGVELQAADPFAIR